MSSALTTVRLVLFRKSIISLPFMLAAGLESSNMTVFPRRALLSNCIIIGISNYSAMFTSSFKYSQNLYFLSVESLICGP